MHWAQPLDGLRQAHEEASSASLKLRVQGAVFVVPVGAYPEGFELLGLQLHLIGGVFTAGRHELDGVLFIEAQLFYLKLNREPVTVKAGHIGREVAVQALEFQ